MNARQKPQRTFLAVTLLTVLAVTTVFLVYAALLATYTGTTVTVQETGGYMQYSTDNSTWTGSIGPIPNGTTWYSRISVTRSPAQQVTIYWSLEKYVDSSWVNQTATVLQTTKTVTDTEWVYPSSTGVPTGMQNWGTYTTPAGSAGDWHAKALIYT